MSRLKIEFCLVTKKINRESTGKVRPVMCRDGCCYNHAPLNDENRWSLHLAFKVSRFEHVLGTISRGNYPSYRFSWKCVCPGYCSFSLSNFVVGYAVTTINSPHSWLTHWKYYTWTEGGFKEVQNLKKHWNMDRFLFYSFLQGTSSHISPASLYELFQGNVHILIFSFCWYVWI